MKTIIKIFNFFFCDEDLLKGAFSKEDQVELEKNLYNREGRETGLGIRYFIKTNPN
jgi:hypothetical protein